jgi:hypothetical protein
LLSKNYAKPVEELSAEMCKLDASTALVVSDGPQWSDQIFKKYSESMVIIKQKYERQLSQINEVASD